MFLIEEVSILSKTKQNNETVNQKDYFRFQKVDDFFAESSQCHTITKMNTYTWDESTMTLSLDLSSDDGNKSSLLIQLATGSIFRIRFNPGKTSPKDYSLGNTRAVVLESFNELLKKNLTHQFNASIKDIKKPEKAVELSFHGSLVNQLLKIRVMYEPFAIEVIKEICDENHREFTLLSTPANGLRYTDAGGFNDYKIMQTINKPYSAKYVGFGEQGGMELVKNNTRITYFNYDNMRYRQVYNCGPFEEREPLYHSDPFFMEVNGNENEDSAYGIFIDNPSEVLLDMGYYNSSKYRFGTRYGDIDYYVIAGNTCGDIIKSFSNIVGTARLIPRYALGYHQGCYGYESRKDVEEVVNKYRDYKIPIDGIHIDVDIQKNYKTFTIDESENKFPNPKQMFSELRKKGIKCSTNITPIISNKDTNNYSTYNEGFKNGYFVADERFDPNNPDGRIYHKYDTGKEKEITFEDKENNYNSKKPFIGEVYYGNEGGVELGTTGHYPDLNQKEVRKWWGEQYKYLFDMGLEMVWQDMTTPCLRETRGDMLSFPARLLVNNDFIKNPDENSDYEKTPVMRIWNLYSYNLHKATYHGLNNLESRKNKRNFIIGRGCFTGMQRFAGLWTGDNSSNWEFLKINISQILALGLTGQALSGQDIGGFERENDWEQWADPELLIRWTAMGAFLPWFRNHYIRKGKKLFQEPYEYQTVIDQVSDKDMYRSVLPVCKYYIELRYTLLQLFYDAMFENTINALPICRALFLTNPKDKSLFNDKSNFLNTEFMVRNELLISPVIEKQSNENGFGKRDIYLPEGNDWYQFTNNISPLQYPISGGTTISEFDASINNCDFHIPYIVPIYVKAGAIIPVLELEQYVGQRNENNQPNPITLNIYPGKEGRYTMYLDDGISRSSQPEGSIKYGTDPEAKGEYRESLITHSYLSSDNRQITIERVHDNYTPKYEDYFFVAVLHEPSEGSNPVKSISINGDIISYMENAGHNNLEAADINSWYYETKNNTTYIKVFDNNKIIKINLTYK